jgi:hypothetical protein
MVHGKRGEISKAAMNTTLLLTFVKREEKYPLEKYLCIEIQTNLRTGMHILYHIKIDIMSWEYLSCL